MSVECTRLTFCYGLTRVSKLWLHTQLVNRSKHMPMMSMIMAISVVSVSVPRKPEDAPRMPRGGPEEAPRRHACIYAGLMMYPG